MKPKLEQVSAAEGEMLWRSASVRFDVPDLETIVLAAGEPHLRLPGGRLARDLRSFADGIEDLEDASRAAQAFAEYLIAVAGELPGRTNDWKDLTMLAFWTVRNAAMIWGSAYEWGTLRDLPLRWREVPAERKTVPGGSLKLKVLPLVELYFSNLVIVAPKWFLDTMALPESLDARSLSAWKPIARAARNDYIRLVLASESERPEQRTTLVHPAVRLSINRMGLRREEGEPLRFSGYSARLKGGDRNQPNTVANELLDMTKDFFATLPEWAFIPWQQTLIGLLPRQQAIFD